MIAERDEYEQWKIWRCELDDCEGVPYKGSSEINDAHGKTEGKKEIREQRDLEA